MAAIAFQNEENSARLEVTNYYNQNYQYAKTAEAQKSMTDVQTTGVAAINSLQNTLANDFVTEYLQKILAVINSGDLITSSAIMYKLEALQKSISTFCVNKINMVEELKRKINR